MFKTTQKNLRAYAKRSDTLDVTHFGYEEINDLQRSLNGQWTKTAYSGGLYGCNGFLVSLWQPLNYNGRKYDYIVVTTDTSNVYSFN